MRSKKPSRITKRVLFLGCLFQNQACVSSWLLEERSLWIRPFCHFRFSSPRMILFFQLLRPWSCHFSRGLLEYIIYCLYWFCKVRLRTLYTISLFSRTSILQERRKRANHDIMKSNLSNERTELEKEAMPLFLKNYQAYLGHCFSSHSAYALAWSCHPSRHHCHLSILIRVAVPSRMQWRLTYWPYTEVCFFLFWSNLWAIESLSLSMFLQPFY